LLSGFFGIALALIPAPPRDTKAASLKEQLLDDGPRGWSRLELLHQKTRFEWTEKETGNHREPPIARQKSGSIVYCGDNFLVWLGDTEAWAGNRRYMFTVKRPASKEQWMLGYFGPRVNDSDRNGDARLGGATREAWCIFEVPCQRIVSHPSFKVTRLDKLPDNSVELIFSLDADSDQDRNLQRIASGRVTFLPDRDWAIAKYNVSLKGARAPRVVASVTYGPARQEFLDIRHVEYTLQWHSDGKEEWNKWETDLSPRPCAEPQESFTLAAFGLPEPALPGESPKSKRWLWLNLVALVCLIAAAVLRLRMKTARK
jgi:hypothetical protein